MHHITEDTPPDMLAGAMDLSIRLPDGRDVHMSIERSTPMMDLLVQVTTAHKLRPSEHIIQALDMTPLPTGSVDRERVLPYKPNTPIGALDTQCIRVLPKSTRAPAPKPPAPPGHQPFESTFRLQVHLPRNQFCVIRVGKHVLLEEIMRKVCEEKNLDPRKYEFRHPANIDKVLDPKRTLNDYEITEITVAYRASGSHLSQTLSSSDIMVLQREEERRKMQKTAGGVLNLIFRRGRTSMGSGSVSSDTRSISPTQSDDSRSVTPPAVQPPQLLPPPLQEQKQPPARPKPPQRKRRPAPKPPTQQPPAPTSQSQPVRESPVIITPSSAGDTAVQQLEQCQPDGSTKLENGLTICHSRNSSDSSGYHEASILSDNCQTTLPRRPKSTVIHTNNITTNTFSNSSVDLSKSTGNLSKMTGQSKSTMSLTTAGRKKKAPPPPPVMKTASSAANINTVTSSVPVVASRNRLEPVPKTPSQPDVSPSLTNLTVPQPKPRTITPQAPVPTPRKQKQPSAINQLSEEENTNQSLSVNEEDIQPVAEFSNSPEKIRRQSKFDTIGRKRGFQIGKSMLSIETAIFVNDTSSLQSRKVSGSESSEKTRTSSSSSQYFDPEDNLDDLDINNIEMFENKHRKRSGKRKSKTETFNRIGSNVEIHELQANAELSSNESMLSLRSVDSMPGSAANMKKWDNVQELDEISFCAEARNRAWLVGDVSDTESTYTPSEVTSFPLASDVSLQTISLTSDVSPSNLQSVAIVDAALSRSSSISEQSYTSTPTIDKSTSELVTSIPTQTKLDQPETKENITHVKELKESSHVESIKTEQILKTEEISVCLVEKNIKQTSDDTELPVTTNIQELHVKPVLQTTVVSNVNPGVQPVITRTQSIDIQQDISPPIVPKEDLVQVLDSLVPHKQSETLLRTRAVLPTLNPLTITPKMNKRSYMEDNNELESEWQYTLPSPPTAFRDSSPTNFTDMTNYDTVTFNGLSADSVVTSPALFEKLASIRDTRSDTDTVVSDGDNLTSQKAQVMTSKYLSLENLEKRKSLVLERELASLKNDENVDTILRNQKNNLINEIEEVITQNKSKSSTLSRNDSQSREKILLAAATDSTLPNFKITTYDQPKAKINIFEDDSVRSSVENKSAETSKRNSIVDSTSSHKTSEDFTLLKKRNSLVSASSENIYFPKRNSVDRGTDEFLFKKPQEPVRFKSAVINGSQHDRINEMVARSESFSSQKNGWSRSNPVKRSKSHISLEKYKDDSKVSVTETDDGLHKSNSLFNVSGLQSLEVMRMILPKLGNTPPSSPVDSVSKDEPLKTPSPKPQPVVEPPRPVVIEATTQAPVVKKYHYGGPPAINLGTWSDRPKSQVSIKEDIDYKISNIATMKAKFSSQTNLNSADNLIKSKSPETPTNFPSVNIRVNSNDSKDQIDGKINIKINSEPSKIISNQSSNVIIKIGNGGAAEHSEDTTTTQVRNENKLKDNNFYSRFLNQTTAAGYRKPLGNINGVDKVKPRPHSIAFDASCPDLSRVPIVRAVELKKPYKDTQGNKTITQIIHDTPDINEYTQKISPIKSNTLNNQNRHSSVYLSSENINNGSTIKPSAYFNKPITRGNSFAAARSHNSPVVKGFRTSTVNNTDVESTNNIRASWNQYGTLPTKSTTTGAFTNTVRMTTTDSVPFSQSMLKKTEHRFIDKAEKRQSLTNGTDAGCTPPPPPPLQIPKIAAVTKKPIQQRPQQLEPRDMMLESIRNFGGRAGLKAVK